jgi:hypothetical protein
MEKKKYWCQKPIGIMFFYLNLIIFYKVEWKTTKFKLNLD